MEIEFPGDGVIFFRSFDNPDSSRGHTADGVVLDEAALMPETAWYDVVRPIISDTNGWALIMGTPKGRNWFWRESEIARQAEDSISWQVPTLGVEVRGGRLCRKEHPMENPYFPFTEAEMLYRTMPERTFQQEFLAQFVENAGAVFRNVREASILEQAQRIPGHNYIMGVDWAQSYDWTVFSVIDAGERKQVARERFNKVDYDLQLERLAIFADYWQPDLIIAEANAMGRPLIDEARLRGLPIQPFQTTQQSKDLIIKKLQLALEKGELQLLNDEQQIMELCAYDMERLPSGVMRYGAPKGINDDMVIALAIAWNAVSYMGTPIVLIGEDAYA